jgi:hypothetical protein
MHITALTADTAGMSTACAICIQHSAKLCIQFSVKIPQTWIRVWARDLYPADFNARRFAPVEISALKFEETDLERRFALNEPAQL